MVVCLPGQMSEQGAQGAATQTGGAAVAFPWVWMLSFVLSHAAIAAAVWVKTRRSIHLLYATSGSSSSITHGTESLFFWARWLTIAATGAHLFTPVREYVMQQFLHLHWMKELLVPELLFITPALLTWLAIWGAGYFVEMAVRERSLPYRLAQQLPVHEMPGMGRYFATQARHDFFPALFLLASKVINLATEGVVQWWYPGGKDGQTVQSVASTAGMVLLLVLLPFFWVHIWSTTPLRGRLRERLEGVAAAYRLRFRNILLWRTHHMTINAGILGWLPFARYFLLSDSLLETFSDRELEAVFAHEVGHGVHRHHYWYMALAAGVIALAAGVPYVLVYYSPFLSGHRDTAEMILSAMLLVVFGGLSLPFIAPRFEHQADWFASRHMARVLARGEEEPTAEKREGRSGAALRDLLAGEPTAAEAVTLRQYVAGDYPHAAANAPLQEAAGGGTVVAGAGGAVSGGREGAEDFALPGAEAFILALDGIADTTQRDRRQRGLMHPSIEDRVELLRRMAVSPECEKQFERSMRRTRLLIVALVAAGVASCVLAGVLANGAEAVKAGAATQNAATQVEAKVPSGG